MNRIALIVFMVLPVLNLVHATATNSTTFKVATLNLWKDGSKVQNATDKAISYLVDLNPDIVLLQEVWNSATSVKISEGLSRAFGEVWSVCGDDALGHSTRIISRLPIHTRLSHNLHRSFDATNCVLSSDRLLLDTWSIHLDPQLYGPYGLCLKEGCDFTQPIEKCEAKVVRMEQRRRFEIEEIIAAQQRNQPSDFVIFGGDFNAPSHLDYTEATREAHCGAVVRWPASVAMERAGFVDTYRDAHLDPSTHPGNTWSTVFRDESWGQNKDQPEPQDRIDFVYVKDGMSSVRVSSADIVPGPEEAALIAERYQAPDNNYGSPWPSDHFAVWADVVVVDGVV